jgi:peptidoglycan biosynthesis protein MviN/MurJ (putative lipid II flippase)
VNVGVNLYAIPHYGPNGAAFATVLGEIVSMAILVFGLLTTP